jgi:hypothetical protein
MQIYTQALNVYLKLQIVPAFAMFLCYSDQLRCGILICNVCTYVATISCINTSNTWCAIFFHLEVSAFTLIESLSETENMQASESC